MRLATLKRRSEFLAVRGGSRWGTPAFLMEGRARRCDAGAASEAAHGAATRAESGARFGFTVTRKLGNAVERNRMRRRLREAIRSADAGLARPGWDYVVVARPAAMTLPFEELVGHVREALQRIVAGGGRRPPDRSKRGASNAPHASGKTGNER